MMLDQTNKRLQEQKTLSANEKRKSKNWLKNGKNSENYAELIN